MWLVLPALHCVVFGGLPMLLFSLSHHCPASQRLQQMAALPSASFVGHLFLLKGSDCWALTLCISSSINSCCDLNKYATPRLLLFLAPSVEHAWMYYTVRDGVYLSRYYSDVLLRFCLEVHECVSTQSCYFYWSPICYTLDRNIERNFHMNECFQINLGCYGGVRACVRARQPTYGMLRMRRWSCWWWYKRAAATKRCDETCYPRAERHEHRQQSRCRRDPALPPPGCLLFQRHTAETRFSFISSQEQWLSAHCVVYVFAFSPVPSICPAAPQLTSNDTLRYRPVCCGPGLELQVRGQTVRWRSNQYTAGAIDTPPLSTIVGTVWYVQQYRVLWKEGGQRGDRRVRTRPGGKTRERGHKAQKGLEQNILFSLFLT